MPSYVPIRSLVGDNVKEATGAKKKKKMNRSEFETVKYL